MEEIVEHQIFLMFKCPLEDAPSLRDEQIILDAIMSLPEFLWVDEGQNIWGQYELYAPEFLWVDEDQNIWKLGFRSNKEIPLEPKNRKYDAQMDALTMVTAIRKVVQEILPAFKYIESTQRQKVQSTYTQRLEF